MALHIKRRVSLDLRGTGHQVTIPFIRGDRVAYEILFTITDGAKVVELPEGVMAAIAIHNGTDGGVLDNCLIDHVNNYISYIPTPEALEVAGNIGCDLHIFDENGAKVGSPRFIFQISETDALETEDELIKALQANPDWNIVVSVVKNAKDAEESALVAEGHSTGTQNGEAVPEGSPYFENNAKHYAEKAASSEENAESAKEDADDAALKSEGYATGTQNGEAVPEGSPYFENNAKHYAEKAASSEENAESAKEDADDAALKSEGYATGTQNGEAVPEGSPYYNNNAKYYADKHPWDHIITTEEEFLNIVSLSGRILVKDVVLTKDESFDSKLEINENATLVDFSNLKAGDASRNVYLTLKGHPHCTLKNLSLNARYHVITIDGFGTVEHCDTSGHEGGSIDNCGTVRDCRTAFIRDCEFVSDCKMYSDYDAYLINCKYVCGICQIDGNLLGGSTVTCQKCHFVSNVNAEGKYEDCTYVDPNTCKGFVKSEDEDKVQVLTKDGSLKVLPLPQGISAIMNTSDYKLTLALVSEDGDMIGAEQVIDFPLEQMIVDVDYDESTNSLIIKLKSGSTTTIPLSDLISGLATEKYVDGKISALNTSLTNKLDAAVSDLNAKITAINESLATKVNEARVQSAISTALAPYEKTADVDAKLTKYTLFSTTEGLANALNLKADKSTVASLNTKVDAKADKTYVDGRFDNVDYMLAQFGVISPSEFAETANLVPVPAKSAKYAFVKSFGGMSYKSANLLPTKVEGSATENGITYSFNKDGGVTLAGSVSSDGEVVQIHLLTENIILPAGTYTIAMMGINVETANAITLRVKNTNTGESVSGSLVSATATTITTVRSKTFTLTEATPVDVYFQTMKMEYALTLYAWINEGESALPYEPYFSGLKSAKVTQIKSAETLVSIPTEIQSLEDNGLGIPDTAYSNTVDLENEEYTHRCISLTFDGSEDENWGVVGTNIADTNVQYFAITVGEYGMVVQNAIFSNQFARATISSSNLNRGIDVANSASFTDARVLVRPDDAESIDLATFKARLAANPLEVVIALSDELTTTEPLPVDLDGLIPVTPGGYIELVTDTGNAVPVNVEFQIINQQEVTANE